MRGDLTDDDWAIIGGLLPPDRGRRARPAQDNRRFLNGIHCGLRVSCPWRDMSGRWFGEHLFKVSPRSGGFRWDDDCLVGSSSWRRCACQLARREVAKLKAERGILQKAAA